MSLPPTLTVLSLGEGVEALVTKVHLGLRAIPSRYLPLKIPTWYDWRTWYTHSSRV